MPGYDRWPLVAASALAPVSLAAVRRPALRPLAVLLCHQTEEWVWPGGFLPWINREVLGSDADEFPLDQRLGFAINVVLGWGTSLLAAAGPRAAGPAAMLYVTHLGNAGLHLGWAARHRRYDPGAATAGALLAPLAVSRVAQLRRDPRVTRRALAAGAVTGAALGAGLVPALRRRLR